MAPHQTYRIRIFGVGPRNLGDMLSRCFFESQACDRFHIQYRLPSGKLVNV